MVDIAKGVTTEMCILHGKFVDDIICSECPDRDECEAVKHFEDFDFPQRSDTELAQVSAVCKGCPLRDFQTGRCQKKPGELLPILTLNQHPASHCPEGKF